MGSFVFNVGKGRAVELYNRVKSNDPTNSAFIVVGLRRGVATDATLKDYTTLQAVLNDANADEVTGTGYARKTLTDSDLAAFPGPDTTNDVYNIDLPDQTWTSVAAAAAWTDLLVCYDSDTSTGTDANVIPVTCHDFAVTPDGSDIVAQIAALGFFSAA